MLKIKDDVDFEKVKEFLLDKKFYLRKDIYGNENLEKYGHFKIAKNKHIIPLNGAGSSRFDIIYDLIEAGMIEKIEKE